MKKSTILLSMAAVVVVIVVVIVLTTKKKATSEHYISYPWGPIDPKRNMFPLSTQAIMNYPSSYFGMCSGPNNCGSGVTYGGADQILKLVQDRHNFMNWLRPKYEVNQGYKNNGNTYLNLAYGQKPFNAWSYL